MKNDEMKSMEEKTRDKEESALFAKARLCSEERVLHLEPLQREVAMSMAKEVADGQASVLRQFEQQLLKEKVERVNVENQASSVCKTPIGRCTH